MKTITEHIRQHLLKDAGILTQDLAPPLDSLRGTEWSDRFERLQRNRMLLGGFRYGFLAVLGKPKWSRTLDIEKRINLYIDTGNLEYLVDIANLAMLEFEEGTHPKKYFKASDDGIHTEGR